MGLSQSGIRDLIRQRADLVRDTLWLPDAEIDSMVQQSIDQQWEHLATIFGQAFAWETGTLAVLAGNPGPYDFSGYSPPFARLRRVEVVLHGVRVPMKQWNPAHGVESTQPRQWSEGAVTYDLRWNGRNGDSVSELTFHPTPSQDHTVIVQYIGGPVYPDDAGVETFGYDEWIVLDVCRKIAMKMGDTSMVASWISERDQYLERMKRDAPPRDIGQTPSLVTDGDLTGHDAFWFRYG